MDLKEFLYRSKKKNKRKKNLNDVRKFLMHWDIENLTFDFDVNVASNDKMSI